MATVDRFNYYFIECNGLWSERLQEVKDKGFEKASPIARLIYECERDNINQHAAEDLKHISATLAMLDELPFTDSTPATSEDDTAAYHGQERAV
jgi:hypothetical protein